MFEVFLLVLTGPLKGHKYLVKSESPILVGRDPDAEISISYDDFCSRKHALIYKDNNDFVIEDLNSTNGTFVNEGRIVKKAYLSDGDIVGFGNTQIIFRVQGTKEQK